MPLVRSERPYAEFTSRRRVRNALHREDDGDGYVVADVDELRTGDSEITEQEFETEAKAIRDYNAALPPPDPPDPPSADEALVEELRSAQSVAAVKEALIKRFGG